MLLRARSPLQVLPEYRREASQKQELGMMVKRSDESRVENLSLVRSWGRQVLGTVEQGIGERIVISWTLFFWDVGLERKPNDLGI